MTATELAQRIRRKQLSACETLEAHLERVERLNPRLNAIVTLAPEGAREQARRADQAAARGEFLGPLHGLPVAHKDLQETRGMRTTYGSPLFENYVPDFDTLLVERVRAAGAILLGKTNTPEFGAGSQTFNPVFGPTRNPFDPSKTCGGSSGGAAVALATGMVALADGSDTGGSLRNPAAFCSVVGLRPSPGRVPTVPCTSAFSSLTVLGPMARTVQDCALFLSAIAGADPRSPLSIDERLEGSLERDFRGVRIAWCPDFAGLPFDRRIRDVFARRRKAFESLGCLVEEVQPDFSEADHAFKVFRALEFYEQHGAKDRARMKATVVEEIERGARLTAADLALAHAGRSRLFARIGRFMETYEFLVLPTTQVPPFDIEKPYVTEIEGVRMNGYIDWMRSCYYISILGLPAISVPAGFTPEGLPTGLQIVGRRHRDWSVLQLAHAFERS